MMASDEMYMRMALEACRRGVEAGQSPFGACIVREGKVLACEHNHVWEWVDPTAHAEIVALRKAAGEAKSVHLEGASIYSTTEPCPMCFAAIHWARVERIVFGARIEDAAEFGFHEMTLSNHQMKQAAGLNVRITPDCLREEALELFKMFRARAGKTY